MRGTHDVIAFHALRPGIIPAYARNTCRNDTRGCCTWDHPRVCGEHGTTLGSKRLKRGSSPRMRGTHSRRLQRRHPQGIIPAHAGNTWWWNWCPASRWDHPRVCGEHTTHDLFVVAELGSSPRMRGTRNHRRGGNALRGTIPAYAGNTTLALLRDVWVLNHPRVCGEHQMYGSLVGWDSGSSPRMRRTHDVIAFHTLRPGIIPAYAGNT